MTSKKRKICVVITARPSYSRIQTALLALRQREDIELQLVLAASALLSRYGQVIDQVTADGFDIARRVYMVLEGELPSTMAKTTGLGVIELATVFGDLQPDFVVTVADRHETLATAVAASYMNIPLVHVQGGEVTGSIDEKVRHAITKLSDYHLVSTEKARERVLRMGEDPSTVFVTGCPSIDIAANVVKKPALDFDPIRRYGGVGAELDLSKGYVVVMQHSVTTEFELARAHVEETLNAICEIGLPTLWFWPNSDAGSDGTSNGIRAFREQRRPNNIRFFKSMTPEDFLRLINSAKCLIGNSSTGIREGSYLGTPVVNIGSRQDGRDRADNVLDAPYNANAIQLAVQTQLQQERYPSVTLYGEGSAGLRIAELVSKIYPRTEKRLVY